MAALTSIAIRVHKMSEMLAFYSQAFGAEFRRVDTYGIESQFGQVNGVELKLVPIRDEVDFEGFPVHQPGFTVADVEAVVALAQQHGGQLVGQIMRDGRRAQAAVRDPDGNTIELYSEA